MATDNTADTYKITNMINTIIRDRDCKKLDEFKFYPTGIIMWFSYKDFTGNHVYKRYREDGTLYMKEIWDYSYEYQTTYNYDETGTNIIDKYCRHVRTELVDTLI